MNREAITSKVVEMLSEQRSVRFGKVQRDPIEPTELAKTAFPAVYVETTDEEIVDVSMRMGANGNLRHGVMEIAIFNTYNIVGHMLNVCLYKCVVNEIIAT